MSRDAIPTVAMPRPRQRGPKPLTLVIVFALLPFAFSLWYIRRQRLDGGFYMPTEFLDAQQQMINMLGIFLIIPVIGLVFYITILLTFERQHRLGRIALLLVLSLVFVGIAYSERFLRSLVTQPLAAAEIASYAEQALSDGPDGLFSEYRYENRVFSIIVGLSTDQNLADMVELPAWWEGALPVFFCRPFGRLFSGPVDRLDLIARDATDSRFLGTITREDCRAWYLVYPIPSRRPFVYPPHWPAAAAT